MNLFLDVGRNTSALRLNHGPDIEPGDIDPGESCALDVADEGPHEQAEVARLMRVTPEWIRQTERSAEAQARFAGGSALRGVLASYLEDKLDREPANSSLGEIAEDSGGWATRPDPIEQEKQDIEAWTERVSVLVKAGIKLRRAWAAANEAGEEPGAEETMVEGIADEIRTQMLESIRAGHGSVRELAETLGIEKTHAQSVLGKLRDEGQIHVAGAGTAARWVLGQAPKSQPPKTLAPRKAAHAAKAAPAPVVAPPQAAAPVELVLELLRAPPGRLEAVERMLASLGMRVAS